MLATDLIIKRIKPLRGVNSCIVVGQDGLVIDSFFSQEEDKDLLAARIFAVFTETTKQFSRMNIGKPKFIVMETSDLNFSLCQMLLGGEIINVFIEFDLTIEIPELIRNIKGILKELSL